MQRKSLLYLLPPTLPPSLCWKLTFTKYRKGRGLHFVGLTLGKVFYMIQVSGLFTICAQSILQHPGQRAHFDKTRNTALFSIFVKGNFHKHFTPINSNYPLTQEYQIISGSPSQQLESRTHKFRGMKPFCKLLAIIINNYRTFSISI